MIGPLFLSWDILFLLIHYNFNRSFVFVDILRLDETLKTANPGAHFHAQQFGSLFRKAWHTHLENYF